MRKRVFGFFYIYNGKMRGFSSCASCRGNSHQGLWLLGDFFFLEHEIQRGNRLASYGVVRVSIGVHNTKKDIDALIRALTEVAKHGPRLTYHPVPEEETYVPVK